MSVATVLGVGDVLSGDMAFGPHVIRRIQAFYHFDPSVTVSDARSIGLDIIPEIADSDALIVVDTLPAGETPGTLHTYTRDAIPMRRARPGSPRELGLHGVLHLLEVSGEAPASVLLVAAVRGAATAGLAMSPQVEAAVGAAEAEIVKELTRLGHPPLRSWVPAALAV